MQKNKQINLCYISSKRLLSFFSSLKRYSRRALVISSTIGLRSNMNGVQFFKRPFHE